MAKLGKPVEFSADEEKKIEWLFSRYPTKEAATIPLLWLVQKKYGWVPEEAVEIVAERCEVAPSHVFGVVSFYTMFHRAPVGRYCLQVCTNLSCQLMGAEPLVDCLRRKLGIDVNETTSDGLFTIQEVECLAACEMAPVIRMNEEYIGPLDEAGVDQLLAKLRAEAER